MYIELVGVAGTGGRGLFGDADALAFPEESFFGVRYRLLAVLCLSSDDVAI